jgi:hypothetical protein
MNLPAAVKQPLPLIPASAREGKLSVSEGSVSP